LESSELAMSCQISALVGGGADMIGRGFSFSGCAQLVTPSATSNMADLIGLTSATPNKKGPGTHRVTKARNAFNQRSVHHDC
jgi:hypothetical protein